MTFCVIIKVMQQISVYIAISRTNTSECIYFYSCMKDMKEAIKKYISLACTACKSLHGQFTSVRCTDLLHQNSQPYTHYTFSSFG